MKKTREEAKKQREAKFKDIDVRLNQTENMIKEEEKRVSISLEQFQNRVDVKLNDLKTKTFNEINTEKEYVRKRFADHSKRMDYLEKLIKDEKK